MLGGEQQTLLSKPRILAFEKAEILLCIISPVCLLIDVFIASFPHFCVFLPVISGFIVFWIYGFIKQAENGKGWISDIFRFDYAFLSKKVRIFLRIITIVFYAISILFFAITLYYGGNPEIKDGCYVILNHGEIVSYLTEKEYAVLSVLYDYGFITGFYSFMFSSVFMMHNDYLK